MAKLTMLTGRISDTHYKNMKMFPFIFFNGVSKTEIDYAISTNKDEESRVTYSLELDKAQNDFMDKRFKALENGIQTLFWKDVKITVLINSEQVYKSE